MEISLKFGWGWTDDVHSILGTICIIFTVLSVLTGTLAAAYMRCYDGDEAWAKKEFATKLGKAHAYVSYFVLFFANVIILGGTITYAMVYLKDMRCLPMGILSFLFFINSLLIGEYWHRKKARSENLALEGQIEFENASKTG